ncbi:NAD+ synthetase [Kangiella sediminilitoris]|uniref:Glutamine-dependent NAD(+) synthetase n=2 Tax=Kangiella sediminilitoris TaxID=1144748 RepID=A0A1B3BB18_9GAMM|nr:NAD+ synthase [Kangiella sediminilitoris]AOE49991.1 NAD+ synthetase [Kangiella sediminilitoris]
MRIALAQNNYIVGDIEYNLQLIKQSVAQAEEQDADIIVFSELSLCGYPPEDLLLRPDLYLIVDKALEEIKSLKTGVAMVVGHPRQDGEQVFNSASFIYQGESLLCYDKQLLPNYAVFDEKRYFTAATDCPVIDFKGVKLSILICEDLWFKEPAKVAKLAGAELILSPNASPYYYGKVEVRGKEMGSRARENSIPVIYVNQVGGQDELIFDGCSSAYNPDGSTVFMAAEMAEDFACIDFNQASNQLTPLKPSTKQFEEHEEIWQALVLGVRDYVRKNGFPGALLGLSGGIDSAVSLAVAVDALGKENVNAVMMPFRYTASISVEDARAEAEALGIEFDVISIEPIFDAFMEQMAPKLEGTEPGVTEQNIQARCRGTILMGLSNKFGRLVLTTGNKSEVAVGYCTLYGDMAGGLDVLKDVPKTMVYQLARYRNKVSPVIPERVITRPPSAELAPDQIDEDNLPPYEVLDEILEAYVEQDKSISDIVSLGHDEAVVRKVIRLVDINEHKRRQAPIGIRISPRAFGRDRRYPITSGFGRQFK